MKTICFWDNQLCERGTTIALFDYAYYNQTLLNNKSIIMYESKNPQNQKEVIKKFEKHFTVIGVDSFDKVDEILKNSDVFYIIKYGVNDGKFSNLCKTVVHCVFTCSEPHGDVYASVSPWVDGNNGKYPVVPHMINLPNNDKNMRSKLNIPIDATVYGRHGGYNQFDIPYVCSTLYKIALTNPNIYFLFVNTRPFCHELPNIIFLPKIIDLELKVEFINTCDAMLWGRSDGETFGLSIAEFSIKNKPVLCCKTKQNAHIHFLKEKCIIYDESNIQDIILNFDKDEAILKDWNAFSDYNPENVMKIFKEVFIDSA
jgi:hypothetical protein